MKLVSFSVADSHVPRPGVLLQQSDTGRRPRAAGYADTLAVIAAGITAIDNPAPTRIPQAQRRPPARAALESAAHLRHRSQLPRPRRRVRHGAAHRARRLLQAAHSHHRPRRRHRAAQKLHRARLRSRTRLRHRQGRLSHSRIGVARARLRLHHHQRRQRARCAARHFAVVASQELPHLLPHGPSHRHRR